MELRVVFTFSVEVFNNNNTFCIVQIFSDDTAKDSPANDAAGNAARTGCRTSTAAAAYTCLGSTFAATNTKSRPATAAATTAESLRNASSTLLAFISLAIKTPPQLFQLGTDFLFLVLFFFFLFLVCRIFKNYNQFPRVDSDSLPVW